MIYTDEQGRPLPGKPDPLPEDATVEEKIAWMRATWAYKDRATDLANKTFADTFRRKSRG